MHKCIWKIALFSNIQLIFSKRKCDDVLNRIFHHKNYFLANFYLGYLLITATDGSMLNFCTHLHLASEQSFDNWILNESIALQLHCWPNFVDYFPEIGSIWSIIWSYNFEIRRHDNSWFKYFKHKNSTYLIQIGWRVPILQEIFRLKLQYSVGKFCSRQTGIWNGKIENGFLSFFCSSFAIQIWYNLSVDLMIHFSCTWESNTLDISSILYILFVLHLKSVRKKALILQEDRIKHENKWVTQKNAPKTCFKLRASH